jgi:hypothetical protein
LLSELGEAGRCATGDLEMKTDHQARDNRRTALILLSIALAFFLGVMAKYWLIGN